MDYPGILTEIVASRGLQPEPVATSALAHLLKRSQAARRSLLALSVELCPGLVVDDLSFTGQVTSGQDQARPDLEGSDETGPRIVVEAKFDAALTGAQRTALYLRRLQPGVPGVLIYVAPADRLPTLWPHLLAGPGGQSPDQVRPPDLLHYDSRHLVHDMADGHILALVSWQMLLGRFEAALRDQGDSGALGDFEQLKGLVAWRTSELWVPLAAGDLPDRAGRQLTRLRDAVIAASVNASTPKTRNGSGDAGPGRWITSPEGRTLWAGLWLSQWGRCGVSPVWVSVTPRPPHTDMSVHSALSAFEAPGQPGLFKHKNKWAIPLLIDNGAEFGEVQAAFERQIRRVARQLDDAAVDTEEADLASSET